MDVKVIKEKLQSIKNKVVEKKKVIIIVSLLVVISISGGIYFYSNREIYGNDEKGIINKLASLEMYKGKENFQILDIIDIDNTRVVPFLYNNKTAIAEFKKNDEGNYVWSKVEGKNDKDINEFLVYTDSKAENYKFLVLFNSNNNSVNKIKVVINEVENEKDIELNKPSVEAFDVPLNEEGDYKFDVTYYDSEGNEIEKA